MWWPPVLLQIITIATTATINATGLLQHQFIVLSACSLGLLGKCRKYKSAQINDKYVNIGGNAANMPTTGKYKESEEYRAVPADLVKRLSLQ